MKKPLLYRVMNNTTQIHKLLTTSLCLTFLAVQVGCASKPLVAGLEKRMELGSIGIVSAQFIPDAQLDMPETGLSGHISGAWEGLKEGSAEGSTSGMELSGPVAMFCGITWLYAAPCFFAVLLTGGTIGGASGGIAGAVAGTQEIEPGDLVQKAETEMKQALSRLKMQEAMRSQVLAVSHQRTKHQVVEVLGYGPKEKGAEVFYRGLRQMGLDSILEIRVLSLGVKGKAATDPELIVFLTVGVRLVRVADDSVIHEATFIHTTEPRSYGDWAADNAHALRKELDNSYRRLAEKVTSKFLQTDLFFESDFR